MAELEGAETKVEVVESTSEEKGAEPTTPKAEPTVGKTYTEKDFRHELDKALGKGLESINKQLSLREKALVAKSAELEEFKSTSSAKLEDLKDELEDTRKEHDQALKTLNDSDVREAYMDRATLRKREREAARRETDAENKLKKAEKLIHNQGLEAKAKILHEETGIPLKEIAECETEADMEVKSLRYKLSHPDEKETEKPQETETPKFDSGTSSGGGGKPTMQQMENWTDEQYAEWAKAQPHNK